MTHSTLKATVAAIALTTGMAWAGTDAETNADLDASTELEQGAESAGNAVDELTTNAGNIAAEAADEANDALSDMAETAKNAGEELQERGNAGTDGVDSAADNPAKMVVADLIGTPVIDAAGEEVGEVDYVVNDGGQTAVIVGMGGILGIAEHDVAVPLAAFSQLGADELRLDSMTASDLEAEPDVDESEITALEDDQPVDVLS